MYGGDLRRTPTPLDPAFQHLMLVEGMEDGRLYEMACKFAGVSDKIEIRSVGGKTEFTNALRLLVSLGQHLRTIAIIRDADDDPRAAFQSACDAMKNAKPGELSLEHEGRSTAVLVVPPNGPGCIESLCWSSLSKHPVATCVEEFIGCARTKDPPSNPSSLAAIDKSRIHVVLAIGMNASSVARVGLRVGEASWDWSHEAFEPVIRFVKAVARDGDS